MAGRPPSVARGPLRLYARLHATLAHQPVHTPFATVMQIDSSQPSPGESPRMSNPWDALIVPSLTPKPVKVETAAPGGSFIWRHMPFKRLSLPVTTTDKEGGSPLLRYRQTRFSSRRVRKRVIFKHGDVNVVQGNCAKRRRRYLQDIFTTLVDAQWRWTLLVFTLNFMLSWLIFAVIWYLIAFAHGDLDPDKNPAINSSLTTDWTPCVAAINSFTSCFLFSVETQHTIGYGGRSTTEECPEAIFVMCIQSVVGVMIQAFMVGIVFVKLSRPIKRTHTLLFSRNAVICQRDGVLCFMFRVGDMRKSHIVEAHIRAQLIRRKVTLEGELLPFHQEELKVGGDGVEDRLFFIWPTMIVHKIDEDSPLYGLSASELIRERFEIVVVLEGIVESTGMTTQARSSYLPQEILWGHRFESLVSFKKETGEYEVDYSQFNRTYAIDTPLCSAAELDAVIDAAREEPGVDGKFGRRKSTPDVDVNSINSRLRIPPNNAVVQVETQKEVDDALRRQESKCPMFIDEVYLRDLEGITVVSPLDLPGPESRI